MTHIQKIAPGPPAVIAVAMPAILPMPMRPDRDIASAWNEDTPAAEVCPETVNRHISKKPRTCMKRVRIVEVESGTETQIDQRRAPDETVQILHRLAHAIPRCK